MSQFNVQQIGPSTIVEFVTPSLMDPIELGQVEQALYKLIDDEETPAALVARARVPRVESSSGVANLDAERRIREAQLELELIALSGVLDGVGDELAQAQRRVIQVALRQLAVQALQGLARGRNRIRLSVEVEAV